MERRGTAGSRFTTATVITVAATAAVAVASARSSLDRDSGARVPVIARQIPCRSAGVNPLRGTACRQPQRDAH